MAAIIVLVGMLQIVAGVSVAISAASAVHEILGAVLFGMGVMCVALGIVVAKLAAIKDGLSRPAK